MSKVSRDTILECVNSVLEKSKEKERKFLETIELQVSVIDHCSDIIKIRFCAVVHVF